jgi:hypothetical protein
MLSDVKSGEQVAFIFISKIYLALRLFARKLFARDKISVIHFMKKCSKCSIKKNENEFDQCKNVKSGIYPSCKECRKKYRIENKKFLKQKNKDYYDKIKENDDFLNKRKIYYQKNKNTIIEQSKINYNKNRNLYNKKRNLRIKFRLKNEPELKLIKNIRRMINRVITTKNQKSIYYLGVKSAEEFIELMNQKTSNKNWIQDDYHIDHIWQVHWFSEALKENAEKTCLMINHHSNLRPIRAEENLIRSKQDFDILKYEDFAKYKNYLNISILEEIKLYKNW